MEIQILVIGLNCYQEQELQELITLLKDSYNLKKLPSSEHYILYLIPENDGVEISEELEDISKHHSNPAWEIITRNINNQTELDSIANELYFEAR